MKNIILCVDHNIGHKVVCHVAKVRSNYFNIQKIYTTDTNNKGFWNGVGNIKCEIFLSNKEFLQEIKKIKNIEYIFLISWKHILSKEVIDQVKIGVINLHYSLLPKYRGVYPINNAIINSEKVTGISFHWVDEGVDSGEVIVQDSIPIELSDTVDSLLDRLDTLAFLMFKKIWSGKVLLYKPTHSVVNANGEYFSKKNYKMTNALDLTKGYIANDLISLIKGKTFLGKSSLYIRNDNGEKIYISIKLGK